jgi:carboxyl-terminal processing protease
LLSPVFAFSRELVNGRINGFDSYRVQQAINFDHDLQPTDFPITDSLFRSFRDFVAADPGLKHLTALVDANRSFVNLQLRFNIVTAAYGRVMADRVFVTGDDQQVARALEVLPRARDLAMSARQRTQQ